MKGQKEAALAELVCELTRNCGIKEEYFASSFNLSPAQVRLLKLFTQQSSYTIKELCELLKLSNGRITQIISALEEKKLIIRKADPKDKRNIIVSLLPGSKLFIDNLTKNYRELHKIILAEVGEKKKEEITAALEVLVNAIQRWVKNK
jgi:MarR family transcriptional regulator, 2-MHQ and catechol-resistance regulon repressor